MEQKGRHMNNFGLMELLCMAPILLISIGLPVATLIFVYLSHQRLQRIEAMVQRLAPPEQ
jgi:flagellar motor switch protein FliG